MTALREEVKVVEDSGRETASCRGSLLDIEDGMKGEGLEGFQVVPDGDPSLDVTPGLGRGTPPDVDGGADRERFES